MPFPCRATKGLDCVFTISFIQRGRVWFTHTMPRPCQATNMSLWKKLLKVTTQRGMGELAPAVQRRHVGDLPAFGFLRLPHGVPRRLLPEAYKPIKTVGLAVRKLSVKARTFTKDRYCQRMAGSRHGMCELAVRGSPQYTSIRRWVAVNGYNHSENRPVKPDLLLRVHFNNSDNQAAVWNCLCDTRGAALTPTTQMNPLHECN
jgi:hypothetical protein